MIAGSVVVVAAAIRCFVFVFFFQRMYLCQLNRALAHVNVVLKCQGCEKHEPVIMWPSIKFSVVAQTSRVHDSQNYSMLRYI